MRDLCVFDLDGTLIPHDSFGRLVRRNLRRRPLLLVAALARRARIMSRQRFAALCHSVLRAELAASANAGLVDEVLAAIIPERRAVIERWRAKGAHLVLLSASPEDYVEKVGAELGFDAAFGSHWADDGRYVHLHGKGKRVFVDRTYPVTQWRRAYAIADAPHDRWLLESFEIAEYV
ncbi:HAD-IB family phosphatase [Oceaniradius stylonematis]|uniref:HAD-IB family phosphatase n=1 Tax=Oceaniradius stylonematis TaxID=2184161 RepID=UPI0027402401|nr:HAD-IB family phosphatase [Oceaniradius stylonematis]